MKICGKNITPEIITQIETIIAHQPDISQRQLSRRVCERLDWRSPNGALQEMSCRVALLQLRQKGQLELPPVRRHPNLNKAKSRLHEAAFPEPTPIVCPLNQLGQITLLRIKPGDRQQSRQWNFMMSRYHYLGAGPLCGAQIRYFIESERHAMLGGLAFSAAAWRVSARDQWIGWDEINRQRRLNQIVNNSRFLILPTVTVKNLASHVLALAAKQLKSDWPAQYAIEPLLLETFVEQGPFFRHLLPGGQLAVCWPNHRSRTTR